LFELDAWTAEHTWWQENHAAMAAPSQEMEPISSLGNDTRVDFPILHQVYPTAYTYPVFFFQVPFMTALFFGEITSIKIQELCEGAPLHQSSSIYR
jgi:hypothetical protein